MHSSTVNYRNLLLVGVGLPIVLAVADQSILAVVNTRELVAVAIAVLFAFFSAQIAFVSWAVARFVAPWPLRWVIWLWTMALIDLQLAVMVADVDTNWSATREAAINCLATGVLAGQLGAVVVWGILGGGPILWRGPSLLIVLFIGWKFYSVLGRVGQASAWIRFGWGELLWVEAAILVALCVVLRLCGFSLRVAVIVDQDLPFDATGRRSLQFSIRDVLIGTTSLAVLLGIAKAGDFLTLRFAQQIYAAGFLFVVAVAIGTAIVLLVALWSALGRGSPVLRVLVLVLSSLAVGSPLAWFCVNVGQPQMLFRNFDYRLAHWYQTGFWWIGWMFLAAAILAASLIIFRTLGYRLVRTPRAARPIALAS